MDFLLVQFHYTISRLKILGKLENIIAEKITNTYKLIEKNIL